MTTYRLFPSAEGPVSPASYSGPLVVGVAFEVTTGGCWLDGYWWWVCPSSQSTSSQKFALWCAYNTDAAILVASATVTSETLTPGEWNYVPLTAPVPLSIGATYIACTGLSDDFPISNSQFGPGQPYGAGIVNGPLTAFSDVAGSLPMALGMSQCLFSVAGNDPTVNLPGEGFESSNLWMDVQVDTTPPAGTSYRLWPNYPQIPGQVSIDTNSETNGTEFSLSEACTLDNIWFYSPTSLTVGGPATVLPSRCAIFDVNSQQVVAGTDNTSPSWSGPAGSGWVACAYSGVILPAGDYKVAVHYGGGAEFYQENIHYFSTPQATEEGIFKSLKPAAWWEMADAAGSSTAADSTGNGYAGSIHGGVTFRQSGPLVPGTGASFDGSTGYVTTSLNLSSTWTALSIVAWVKISSGSTQVSGIAGNSNAISGGGANLQVADSGGDIEVQANLSTSTGLYQGGFVAGTPWGDGNWHHIAVVWNGTTVSAYVDGALAGSPAPLTGTLTAGSANVAVGLAGGAYMLGDLAQCAVFNYALSAVDVAQLYHQATYTPGPGANGITTGPLSSPDCTNAATCIGNSTGVLMTGNSTYQEGPFSYPNTFDVNDGGENRWTDVEVTPAGTVTTPPGQTVNSGAFLVFFP